MRELWANKMSEKLVCDLISSKVCKIDPNYVAPKDTVWQKIKRTWSTLVEFVEYVKNFKNRNDYDL